MKAFINRIFPAYSRIPLVFTLALNCSVYWGARIIAGEWTHHNIEASWDRAIPLVEWTVVIYLLCYVFWVVNYLIGSSFGKAQCYRFLMADWIGKAVCFLCYVVYPTTNTRPEIVGDGIFSQAMQWLYQADAADNLFPSIHCFVSWICYIGIRGNKNIPCWYRIFSCVAAIAVFISTLTTKQHVLYDVAAGVALAEITYILSGWIVKKTSLGKTSDTVHR